jgi:hypothetical protein
MKIGTNLKVIVSYKSRTPLLAKDARNGAPAHLSRVPHQVQERIKSLTIERDNLFLPPQGASRGVNPELPEVKVSLLFSSP